MDRKCGIPHGPSCLPIKYTFMNGPISNFLKSHTPMLQHTGIFSFLPLILGTEIPFEVSLSLELWERQGSPGPGLSSLVATCTVDALLVTERWTAAAFSQSV